MDTAGPKFSFRDVVLVADRFDSEKSLGPAHARRDLEMTDDKTLQTLQSAITSLGLKVWHYDSPEMLARHAERHSKDVVLAIYGGQQSRNRMALVPAICESFGLRFIGPDVYGRIVAQDKELSKRLATDSGLSTPAWRVVRHERDLSCAFGLNFPVVVKPLMEGSSIGISQRSRISSEDDAATLARELLVSLSQPVLIEEFVPGREVAYSRIETGDDYTWGLSEIVIKGDPGFFENRLFDAHEKQFRTPGRTVVNIDQELKPDDRARIEDFLAIFGRYGYCRVDGRLANGNFEFIELTPDAWLGESGQFAMAFTTKGWSYAHVIATLLASTN